MGGGETICLIMSEAQPALKRVRGRVRRERGTGGAGGGGAMDAAVGVGAKKSLVRLGRLRRDGVVVRGLDALASLHVPTPSPPADATERWPGV